MRKKISFSFLLIILLSVGLRIFIFSTESDDIERQKEFNSKYSIYALSLPKNLSFANEKVTLEDFDVLERIDKELLINTYWQSQTLLMHKRASRWFPVIEPILKRYGIPEDFKYISLTESGLTNVVSPAGAAGYWQFLESTGKKYGLEINSEVDERYHVEKATEAACRYFKEAHDRFGNWTLTAASYNMGMDAVGKALEKQKVNNYYELLLNDETSRYIFRILALKEVITKPLNYGYHFRRRDLYAPIPYNTVTIDTTVTDLVAFAEIKKSNYKFLKLLNPWMRQSSLTNKSRKPYKIKILKPGFDAFSDFDMDESFAQDDFSLPAISDSLKK